MLAWLRFFSSFYIFIQTSLSFYRILSISYESRGHLDGRNEEKMIIFLFYFFEIESRIYRCSVMIGTGEARICICLSRH